MSTNPTHVPYGAFELKASYQKNLLIGNLSVFSTVLLFILIPWILTIIDPPDIKLDPPQDPFKSGAVDPIRPDRKYRIKVEGGRVQPNTNQYAIPIPVDESEVVDIDDEIILKRIENNNNGLGIGDDSLPFENDGNGSFEGYDTTDLEIYPGEDEFVVCEKLPEMIYNKIPEYPKLCKKAGLEGKVYLKVLVDIDGSVKKALIVKSSEIESFDNSALDAALQNKFSPALQNSIPIAIWVSYTVQFKLK